MNPSSRGKKEKLKGGQVSDTGLHVKRAGTISAGKKRKTLVRAPRGKKVAIPRNF